MEQRGIDLGVDALNSRFPKALQHNDMPAELVLGQEAALGAIRKACREPLLDARGMCSHPWRVKCTRKIMTDVSDGSAEVQR
jgi:hypothetical protein